MNKNLFLLLISLFIFIGYRYDADGHAFWAIHDIAGDLVALCDLNGTNDTARVVAQWRYDPYGEVLSADHPHASPSRRLGHKGLFVDDLAEDFAIYHNRNRTYMPKYGRFAQRDPHAMGGPVLGRVAYGGRVLDGPWPEEMSLDEHFGDGMNTFAYLASNPLLAEDPLGLFLPGPSDFITGMLEALVTTYATNQEWDVNWAGDWSMGHDWNTRLDNKWVYIALGQGLYDAFDINIPYTDIGWNPMDAFASASTRKGAARKVAADGGPRGAPVGRADLPGHGEALVFRSPEGGRNLIWFNEGAVKFEVYASSKQEAVLAARARFGFKEKTISGPRQSSVSIVSGTTIHGSEMCGSWCREIFTETSVINVHISSRRKQCCLTRRLRPIWVLNSAHSKYPQQRQ
jgi:RHS repeat-associated protein